MERVRDVVAEAERLEDVAGFERSRGAGRAGADGDVVDAHQQRLAFDVDEAHVQVAGQVVLHVAVDVDVVERLLELGLEVVAEFESRAWLRRPSRSGRARRPRPGRRCRGR